MKKATLIFLIIFVAILLGVYGLGLAYPPVKVNQSTPTSQQATTRQQLTLAEATKHATRADCYLIVSGKVYDVSTYINEHPAGSKSIATRCGKEVTGIFSSIHSNFAWDLLGNYYLSPLASTNAGTSTSGSPTAVLNSLKDAILQKYPSAEVISIKPKSDFYVAKLILSNSLYEIHLTASGDEISREVENDEYDWSSWDTDEDDN